MALIPVFTPPDFSRPALVFAPVARFVSAPAAGVPPDYFHATANYPEYVHLTEGHWLLVKDGRI